MQQREKFLFGLWAGKPVQAHEKHKGALDIETPPLVELYEKADGVYSIHAHEKQRVRQTWKPRR